jgi:hypothetical protein
MRLLDIKDNGEVSLTGDFINVNPPYAILSHTWGRSSEEVTFKDMTESSGKTKAGYKKISFCGDQAARDGLRYFWVDSCCIDASNSVELQESLNSMFRWYRGATKCYVYLSDVSTAKRSDQFSECTWEIAFRQSRWFTRSWTLQDLLAPISVEFFSQEGERLGDKRSLERQIYEITGIAVSALQGTPLSEFTVAERLSWSSGREATRKEDLAYSLLGLFGVQMPLLFGEGEAAMVRLMEEIIKTTEDYSILLWFKKRATSFRSRQPGSHSSPDDDDDQMESRPNWKALKVHSPIDLMSTESLRHHLSPLDQVPEPPQVSSRGLRLSLYAKRVRSSLIAWTYCTQERNGQGYAVCLRVLSEGAVTEANRSYPRGTISGGICYVKVNRLKGFELCVIYFPLSEFWAS